MQFLLFLIASFFARIAISIVADLFASDPELLNTDGSNPDAQLLFSDDKGPPLSTNDIWTNGGSQMLTFNTDDSIYQPLDLTSPSSIDDLSNPQLSSPSDISTLPGTVLLPSQQVSAATGERCSADGIMSNPISRRNGLDWILNLFKGTGASPENSPKLCPAPPSSQGGQRSPNEIQPQPQTGGDGSGGRDPLGVCESNRLLCCPGELVPGSNALEYCWDYRPSLRELCRHLANLWCCYAYWEETGVADLCYRAYPAANWN